MKYLAVVAWDANNRIAKFAEFDHRENADGHVSKHGGLVVDYPAQPWPHWLVDPVAKTVSVDIIPSKAPEVDPLSPREIEEILVDLDPQAASRIQAKKAAR